MQIKLEIITKANIKINIIKRIGEFVYISEVAALTGLSIHTLRYYEKEGLLKNISRNTSGRRIYSKIDLGWLQWIQRLKSTGMSLDEIKKFSNFRSLGNASITDRKNMLIEHAEHLSSEINRLQSELAVVKYKVTAYEKKEIEVLT